MTRFRKHSSVVSLGEWKFFTLEKRRLKEDYLSDTKRNVKKAAIKRRIVHCSPHPLFLRQEIIDIIYSKGDLS